ncbi:threonylcarbamoyl-AMP synthase-like [Gigantopelta aegis]|uniref:threonylcarbamoyl-AMP synthase-like n=1 Tax=Gigantopelta aegis TaxID=1735272 RepID=UPI001B88AA34|nr:threonylcarbamoyl-AMP synthase-like [Gigantopelta aegis]
MIKHVGSPNPRPSQCRGEIKCFRIGCTPKATIDKYLEEAKVFVGKANSKSVCPVFPSRRSSALRTVAKILDNGGVIGTPTDTVYAIAASCKHPDSIRRLYTVKGRPTEKPICLCVSHLDQLRKADPPFSPLLWNFMNRCYPGGISCVVPKGSWLYNLGLGDAYDIIGTAGSICIRIPDSSVLAYLVSVSGPIAITSGNPSGGADSTHHDMLIGSLGHKLDGIICDGESRESCASTVVSCLKIDQGTITYFREGCTPKEVVDKHLEDAIQQTNSQLHEPTLQRHVTAPGLEIGA